VDDTISEGARDEIEKWRKHDEEVSNFCDVTSEDCEDCAHVDLTINPERFTGYSGEASRKVWRAIYEENCFSPEAGPTKGPFSAAFGQDKLAQLCLEKRAFYRAVSGLHSSITIHLSSRYPLEKASSLPFVANQEKWGHNLELFLSRFDPEMTGGQGPYWLKNLYFVYLLELRALAKAETYLARETFFTGNSDEDKDTAIAVKELLSLVRSFPNHFDESSLFSGGSTAQELKHEFKTHFRNISRLMDCVNCDKCRLWGKLQVTGLGTALKILFSGEFDQPRLEGLPQARRDLKLTRNEIVALFNAFGRISTSVMQLETFREMIKREEARGNGRRHVQKGSTTKLPPL
jgi:ERO1-like protein alpha